MVERGREMCFFSLVIPFCSCERKATLILGLGGENGEWEL